MSITIRKTAPLTRDEGFITFRLAEVAVEIIQIFTGSGSIGAWPNCLRK